MDEPPQLLSARRHLARAEATYRSEEGLHHLEQGLALLDEVICGGDAPGPRTVARNLASTYATRILSRIRELTESDHGAPEPELEHVFNVVLAFDEGDFDLPADARSIKISLARRLIDRYYEGYSPAEKQKAVEQLARIADDSERSTRMKGSAGQRKRTK